MNWDAMHLVGCLSLTHSDSSMDLGKVTESATLCMAPDSTAEPRLRTTDVLLSESYVWEATESSIWYSPRMSWTNCQNPGVLNSMFPTPSVSRYQVIGTAAAGGISGIGYQDNDGAIHILYSSCFNICAPTK